MVGDFGWEHEGTKSGVGTVKEKYELASLIPVFFSGQPHLLGFPKTQILDLLT